MKRSGQKSAPPTGPVTIVFRGRAYHGDWRGGTVRRTGSNTLIQANVRRDDEGVTWIRGHHAYNSTEVRALRAAVALLSDPLTVTFNKWQKGFL